MMKAIFGILLLVSFSTYAAEEAKLAVTTEPVVNETVKETTAATTVDVKLAEDQIPLNIAANKKAVEAGGSSTRIIFTGFVLFTLLSTAYYFVRKYKGSNKINKSNMEIKVISQHYLGPKKSLAIIRVSGESILIGITDANISMIKSLSLIDDEVPAEAPQNFADTLSKETSSAGRNRAQSQANMVDELDEEFSFSGVKDSVSKKIKSMRSFS
ncbi:MAG: flagellar biosynthetic protein FliO [Bdellovibrio sp.]|nr:flagellar biosynthetic protein FliO [Bdellovibrio sp.]